MSGRARCPRCGEGVRGAPAFCPACGTRLDAADAAAVEVDLFGDGRAATGGADELVFETHGRRRSRTIGIAVAGVLALAVGASVATGGGDGQTAPTTTTTTAEVTTTTSAPEATTTTTLGPISLGTGPLLGERTGLSAVVTLNSALYRVDLDTGRAEPLHVDSLAGDIGSLVLTRAGLLVNDQNGAVRLLRPGASRATELIDQSRGGGNYAGEGPPGRLWLITYDDKGSHLGYVEPAEGTAFTELTGPYANGGARADGLGGAVFTAPGGAYRVQAGGTPSRVAEGYLLDAANGRVLTLECDAELRCTWQVLDLANGSRWNVAAPGEVSTLFNVGVALAPDGRHVVRTSAADGAGGQLQPSGRSRVEVFDATGLVASFEQETFGSSFCGPFGCGGGVGWSTDGSWLLGLSSSSSLWGWRPGLTAPVSVRLDAQPGERFLTFGGTLAVGPTDVLPVRPA